ncbi:MAG: type IIL restriction-modification enzyme MmeI [Opitutales bacterium]
MLASETVAPPDVEAFIARWRDSGGAERANYALFLTELCDVLRVPHPDPSTPDNAQNAYVIDRSITRRKADGTHATVYADCYKRGCFILETKQGTVEAASSRLSNTSSKRLEGASTVTRRGHGVRHSPTWDIALERAYHQAAGYIRDLPAGEGRPPFLIVCDVGYVIELYSEFTCTGGSYVAFPDPRSRRIYLEDLRDAAIRERLRLVWTDPQALDPSRHAAKVTREVAEHFARLAKSLEADGHDAFTIATFL